MYSLVTIIAIVTLTMFFAREAASQRTSSDGTVERGTLARREYQVFVPTALEGAAPLVVALHGCWQTAEDFARGTRLNAAAAQRGFLVVYPIQTRADNPSRCWNWFEPRHQSRTSGETAEILGIVDEVKSRHAVRSDRVIVVGFSAGGFMAVNLACASPDTWVGLGVAAGGPYRCGTGVAGGLTCMLGQRLDPERSRQACDAAGGRKLSSRVHLAWHVRYRRERRGLRGAGDDGREDPPRATRRAERPRRRDVDPLPRSGRPGHHRKLARIRNAARMERR